MIRMTRTVNRLAQARLSEEEARRLDADIRALGLDDRSTAVRLGLRLVHRRAREARLAQSYDEFYAREGYMPESEVAAIGGQLAGDVIADRERHEP